MIKTKRCSCCKCVKPIADFQRFITSTLISGEKRQYKMNRYYETCDKCRKAKSKGAPLKASRDFFAEENPLRQEKPLCFYTHWDNAQLCKS